MVGGLFAVAALSGTIASLCSTVHVLVFGVRGLGFRVQDSGFRDEGKPYTINTPPPPAGLRDSETG